MPRSAGNSLEKTIRSHFEDLQSDLNRKHEENREAWAFETRMTACETKLTSIIGDNSGGSGLLHKIDEKVDTLQSEFAGIKKVLVFLAFIIPLVTAIALAIIYKH